MNASEDLAPAVTAILEAARERPLPADGPIQVEARSFPAALDRARSDGGVPIIAEVKPTSPTTDGTRRDDPVDLARAMERGGASAISVLTEPTRFGGSTDALRAVRSAVEVPVLRKDFILREEQLDAVAADLLLLIVRFLESDLEAMLSATKRRGFQPLVEVHTEAELEQAVEAGADLIGINNRDLGRLAVDLTTFERLAPKAPGETLLVAESGISTPAEVRRMRNAGADALLIGSSIMAGDVERQTRKFVEANSA